MSYDDGILQYSNRYGCDCYQTFNVEGIHALQHGRVNVSSRNELGMFESPKYLAIFACMVACGEAFVV
jgi:hypothetical protein